MNPVAIILLTCTACLCAAGRQSPAGKPHRPGSGKFILPGTKWCGIGNRAQYYDDLGGADDTDSCCRDHDRAPGGIKVGQTLHNITNTFNYTIKPCEADEKFRQCLRQVDSRVSKVVGYFFFNILRSKCYALRPQRACDKKSIRCVRYRELRDRPNTWQLVDNKRF